MIIPDQVRDYMTLPAEVADADEAQSVISKLNQRFAEDLGRRVYWNDHYEGTQKLAYLDPELLALLNDRIQQVVIYWPQLVVDSLVERLDVRGFRLPGQDSTPPEIAEIWQANDLDEEQDHIHTDALALGRSATIIGTRDDDDDMPLITAESPLEVYCVRDPRTREVSGAAKWWQEIDGTTFVNLYLRNETWRFTYGNGRGMVQDGHDRHNLRIVPVVPYANKTRTQYRAGVSELQPVIPLSDAANKMATDMMVSGEFHASPRRVAYGFEEKDFVDRAGKTLNRWAREAYALWFTKKSPKDAKVDQLPEADLRNFIDTLNQLAEMVSGIAALPPEYLGRIANQPASADAVRSHEARLIKRAERRQRGLGGSHELTMRIARKVREPDWDMRDWRGLETWWWDAATPTLQLRADAAVKLYANGQGPVTLRQTREDLGYSDVQIQRMEREDEQQARREALRIGLSPLHEPDDVLPGQPAVAQQAPEPSRPAPGAQPAAQPRVAEPVA